MRELGRELFTVFPQSEGHTKTAGFAKSPGKRWHQGENGGNRGKENKGTDRIDSRAKGRQKESAAYVGREVQET